MGLFSGLTEIISAPFSMLDDVFEGDNPVEALRNQGERIDRGFRK